MRVQPLDLASAVELVRKLPFDDPVKERFVADLHGGLFKSHESFLSNPLLLSIMLLTYSDIAHIPTKLSIFYTQAYESLFQKHDALKGGFRGSGAAGSTSRILRRHSLHSDSSRTTKGRSHSRQPRPSSFSIPPSK